MSIWSKQELENMLEDVVNELDLSETAIEEHGPLGTAPSVLVRLVLAQKDREIDMLKRGFVSIGTGTSNCNAELEARIAALEAENQDLRSGAYLVSVIEQREAARKALEEVARQAKSEEIEEGFDVDFEGAYDMCVDAARAALSAMEGK